MLPAIFLNSCGRGPQLFSPTASAAHPRIALRRFLGVSRPYGSPRSNISTFTVLAAPPIRPSSRTSAVYFIFAQIFC